MTSLLFENPWPLVGVVVAIELILIIAILVTGRGLILGLMALVGILGGGLFLLERLVVTESERVANVLDEICVALEANDLNAVLVHIAPEANDVRQTARYTLPQVVIREALITEGPTVEVAMNATPPTAVAKFIARVQGTPKGGGAGPYEFYFRRFEVTFQERDGRWEIASYKDFSVR